MNDNNWVQIIIFGVIFIMVGGLLTYFFMQKDVSTGLTDEEIDKKVASEIAIAIADKAVEIEKLKNDISQLENATGTKLGESGEITVIKKTIGGFFIDEIFLEVPFNDELDDKELSFFDGEIEFDGEDYDAEEILILNGLELMANDNDFDGVVYLTIPEGSISYKFVIEEGLNISEIGEDDETLTFDFLGREVEVSEWKTNEITFTQGEEFFMNEQETVTVDGKEITLEFVLNNAAYVSVDGIGKKIDEGDIGKVGNLEIKTLEVLHSGYAGGINKATLIIGKNVELTIEDGDEYSKNNIWEWTIDENSIGLVLIEDFLELDEEFNALSPEEKICLPNNYVCIEYNGLIGEDVEEYSFDIYERDDIEYVRVKGNFLSAIDVVYISIGNVNPLDDGIYEKDGSKFKLINNETIELGDTESLLNISTDDIVIEDFRVNMLLDNLDVYNGTTWINKSSEDEDYRTLYGILIDNPEDSMDDKEFTITVPEDKLEGSITIKDFTFKEVA